MSSVSSGFRSVISDSALGFRALLALVAVLLLPGLTGCDSESLILSDDGHLDTALRLIGPDGTVVGYADFRAVESHADLWFESITGETPDREEMTEEFESRTGVDVDSELDAIYGTVDGGVGAEEGSIIVFGTWDTDDLIDHLDDNVDINRIEHSGPESITAYGIAEGQSGHGTLFLAVSPDGYIMMSSSESRFESMMARALTNDPIIADEPFLNELSNFDVWMTVNDPRGMLPDVMPGGGNLGMIGPVFESVARAGFGADLSDDMARALLLLEPREDVRADDLANVIRGGIAAARFQLMSDPNASEMVLDLLDRIDVESRSNSVAVTMSISRSEAADLAQMFEANGS